MTNELLIWVALMLAFLALTTRRGRLSPLLLANFAGLSVLHVPGVLNYFSDSPAVYGLHETQVGFRATLVGMLMLFLGALVARTPLRWQVTRAGVSAGRAALSNRALGVMMIVVGIGAYFVALPIASMLPSLTAAVAPLGTLLIVGFWYYAYDAAERNDKRHLATLLLVLPVLPISTLALGGFLGFGVMWVICILAFVFCMWPRRIGFVLAAPLLAYVGLSLGVAYFQERSQIRELVWEQGAPIAERLDGIAEITRNFEWYSLANDDHAHLVESRLNQNLLVGAGIESHEQGFAELRYGATVPLWSLVPRVIWPDKPEIGGGLQLVSEFTGIVFAEGTSVGSGQVLEFYMNFGWWGIAVGFFLLGMAFARLDHLLVEGLSRQDLGQTLFGGMVGLALLNPGGNFLETFISCVAAAVVAYGLTLVLARYVEANRSRFVVKDGQGTAKGVAGLAVPG